MSTPKRPRRWPLLAASLVAAAFGSCSPVERILPERVGSRAAAAPGPDASLPYPLDAVDRYAPAGSSLRCPDLPLVPYAGTLVRYGKPVRVHPAFAERLRAFERVLADVAIEHYGRAPRRLQHAGAYACRRVRGRDALLSEHALGNGIDVVAFELPALPRRDPRAASLPPALRRPFKVTLKAWQAAPEAGEVSAAHARFLDDLARRLVARPDIFRVLLGPAHPQHKQHFHFDCAPYRYVAIWTRHDWWRTFTGWLDRT